MTKTDLAARPVFHRLEDSIQAHLTIVFAALAVSRERLRLPGRAAARPLRGYLVGMEVGHRVRRRHGPDLAARCGSQKRGAGRPDPNRTVLQRRSVRCRRLRIHRRRGGIREQGATRTGRGLEANWTSETPPALVAEPASPW